MSDYRLELAGRITNAEREHRHSAEQLWQAHDVIAAVRERGIADGLEHARHFQLEIAARERAGGLVEPHVLDRAFYTVWLSDKTRWRDVTIDMTTEEKNAAADAVERYDTWARQQENEPAGSLPGLRWWSE